MSGDGATPGPRLLRRQGAPDALDGAIQRISPADAGWRFVGFSAHRLSPGQSVRHAADDREVAVVVQQGSATIRAGRQSFPGLGSRSGVFDGPSAPVMLVAPGTEVEVTADSAAVIVMASAPGGELRSTRLIEASGMLVEQRGAGNTARTVHHLLPPAAEAGRLILFEVFTPAGNWSSYPPHKHDVEDPPRESQLEELYHYRFARPTGFAFARVYTPDRSLDETLSPSDGDVVLVPRGYHPVGMPAGYDGYYLNVMAGPSRRWHFSLDPDHAWLMDWDPAAPR